MERLTQRDGRDQVLLGHAPRDPFADPDAMSGLPRRKSDVDFKDVFGGPPRRSSIYEMRHSLGESYTSRERGLGEEVGESRRPWSSFGEKPVFGESSSPARRRNLGDDFFGDIFRGNDSVCSTPRMPDRSPFSSRPGSRVLSPTRSLPPRSELFGGGSSLPARLSLSTKLTKGLDHPAFSSPTPHALHKNEESVPDAFSFPSSPTACVPTIQSRVVPAQYDLRSDAYPSYRQSPLSRQISHSLDRSLEATVSASSKSHDTEGQFKKESAGSKAYNSSSQFHFSIYKWASKGVTLVMPSNSKERTKNGSKPSGVSAQDLQGVNLPSDNENMPTGSRVFQSQCETQDTSPSNDHTIAENDNVDLTKEVGEVLPAVLNIKSLPSDVTEESVLKCRKKIEPQHVMSGASHDIGTCNKTNERVHVSDQEARKAELKNLCHLLNDDSDGEGNEDIIKQAEKKQSLLKASNTMTKGVVDAPKIKQRTGGKTIRNRAEMTISGVQDAPVTLEDKVPGNRIKGKVKEFIKIFNQEASPKSSGTVETCGQRSRVKNELKGKVEDQASVRVAKSDEEEKVNDKNIGEALSAAPDVIDQILKKSQKPVSDRSSAHRIYDSSSERNDTSVPWSDSTPESFDASFVNIKEAHFEDLEECLVKQLSQEQNEIPQADSHQEEIQISDAKIRDWSKGKEGNIRSLLSTLQYILWPGSGWKPVPLVDIIEASSVKRAYQKALLCLHPDKLQQKGASMRQKYIAEKVFDVLQEAWTHFSSL